ncbi:MAG TPA: hypothetical protein VI259_19450 [Gemmatimonadaceae bacterium]
MSVRASSNLLTLAVLIGPIAALANQGLVYAIGTSACETRMPPLMHLVEALTLIICMVAFTFGYRVSRRISADDERQGEGRTRFMALSAVGTGVFSAAVIIAQWVAVLTFSPCMRA